MNLKEYKSYYSGLIDYLVNPDKILREDQMQKLKNELINVGMQIISLKRDTELLGKTSKYLSLSTNKPKKRKLCFLTIDVASNVSGLSQSFIWSSIQNNKLESHILIGKTHVLRKDVIKLKSTNKVA